MSGQSERLSALHFFLGAKRAAGWPGELIISRGAGNLPTLVLHASLAWARGTRFLAVRELGFFYGSECQPSQAYSFGSARS